MKRTPISVSALKVWYQTGSIMDGGGTKNRSKQRKTCNRLNIFNQNQTKSSLRGDSSTKEKHYVDCKVLHNGIGWLQDLKPCLMTHCFKSIPEKTEGHSACVWKVCLSLGHMGLDSLYMNIYIYISTSRAPYMFASYMDGAVVHTMGFSRKVQGPNQLFVSIQSSAERIL